MTTNHFVPSGRSLQARLSVLASAAVALAVASCSSSSEGGSGGQAGDVGSCVSAVFGTMPDPQQPAPGAWPTLGAVAQGHSVRVYGKWYFAGPCQDTVTRGGPLPSARPEDVVVLTLRTSDGVSVDLATVHPDATAAFSATLDVPVAAATGPATITDNRGHLIKLVITEP
jgi:hypothetical protein